MCLLAFNINNLNALNIWIIIYIGREEFNTYQKKRKQVDKGHPWRTAFSMLNASDKCPLLMINVTGWGICMDYKTTKLISSMYQLFNVSKLLQQHHHSLKRHNKTILTITIQQAESCKVTHTNPITLYNQIDR